MNALTKDILEQLAAFFPAKNIQWKPQSVRGNRALAVAYIDARDVMRRLDDVVAGEWEFFWTPDGENVRGTLVVCGMTREDVGEQGKGELGKSRKTAVSDALKRCGVHFGIGRYLYYLDAPWLGWDNQDKCFTEVPKLPAWAIPPDEGAAPDPGPSKAKAIIEPVPSPEPDNEAPADNEAPPRWLGRFWGWVAKFLELNEVETKPEEVYEWFKANGHMKPHLREYEKLGTAQAAFMTGLEFYKKQETA